MTRVLVIADTHIMGPRKSFKIDKWRREWEMRQAFAISNRIYQPETIIHLGDLFDEGSFSPDEIFTDNIKDFNRIFPHDNPKQERIIIPGNHDVGFHNQMIQFPYLLQRFRKNYPSTAGIELINSSSKLYNSNFVVSNSMTFYNDTCSVCSHTIDTVKQIGKLFEDKRKLKFVSPILLIHIPLYREDDSRDCVYPESLRQKVKVKNVEGIDVIHKEATQFLLKQIRPRLILSGHTHMNCRTKHSFVDPDEFSVEELTLTSYNHKYAEDKPGFMLLSVNSTHFLTQTCNQVEEWVIASIYLATVVMICIRMYAAYRRYRSHLEC